MQTIFCPNKTIYKSGWWIQISPLAKIDPEEWIAAIYKKGKTSWITEECKDGFADPISAKEWGINYINSKNKTND